MRGAPEQPGFFRKPWGDRWALAGDAATTSIHSARRILRILGVTPILN